MTNAIITGGSYVHHIFCEQYKKFFDNNIYILDLEATIIDEFDYIILTSKLNESLINNNIHKLKKYLNNGGNIICFSSVPDCLINGLSTRSYRDQFTYLTKEYLPLYAFDKSLDFFKFLSVDDCKWYYLNTFIAPSFCSKILINEVGESIIFKDNYSFNGSIYAISLDVDMCIGLMHDELSKQATLFFDKLMTWIHFELRQKK